MGATIREEGDEAGSEFLQRNSGPWKHLFPVSRPFHFVSSAWNWGVNSHSVVLISGKSLPIYLHNCWWTQLGIMMSCIKMKRNGRPYRETKKEQAVFSHTTDPSWRYFFCILCILTMETKLINHRSKVLNKKKVYCIGIPSFSKKLKILIAFSPDTQSNRKMGTHELKGAKCFFQEKPVSVSLQFQEDWNKEMGNEKI